MRFPASLVSLPVWALVVVAGFNSATAQQYSQADLMPLRMADSLGLEQAWLKNISAPFGRQSIVDQTLYVDSQNVIEYLEIIDSKASGDKMSGQKPAMAGEAGDAMAMAKMVDDAKVLARFRLGQIGESGRPIDKAEAERLANNEIRRLKRFNVSATTRMIETPQVLLYSLANDGTLERRDAETGELDWRIVVGKQALGYGSLGVGTKNLIVTNGGNLIQVRASDGLIVDELRTGRPPRFGATVSGNFGLLHTTGGNIEAYPLDDVTLDPYIEHVQGSALTTPVRIPSSARVGWSTDRGYVYVMELEGTPATLFRLKTDGLVPGGLSAADGKRFFFASDAGQAYGLRATKSGEVIWVESIGEPIRSAPVVAGDRVLFLSVYGNLYCLDASTGERLWDEATSGIFRLHAAFDDKLYAVRTTGDLVAVHLEDGSVASSAGAFQPTSVLKNELTNRLYILSDQGMVQCLRPTNSPLPQLLTAVERRVEPITGEDAKPEREEKSPADDPFNKPADDPFGAGGNDPFGAGAGDDPFGVGKGGDDPFGGDPFN